jgi:hypothetical protein
MPCRGKQVALRGEGNGNCERELSPMKKESAFWLLLSLLLASAASAQEQEAGFRMKPYSFQFGSTSGGRQVTGTGRATGIAYTLPGGYKSLELFHTRVAGTESVYYGSNANIGTSLETTGLFYTARTKRAQDHGFYTGIGGGLVYEKTVLLPSDYNYNSLPLVSRKWNYQLQVRWIAAGYNYSDDIFGELSYQGGRNIVAFNVGYRL